MYTHRHPALSRRCLSAIVPAPLPRRFLLAREGNFASAIFKYLPGANGAEFKSSVHEALGAEFATFQQYLHRYVAQNMFLDLHASGASGRRGQRAAVPRRQVWQAHPRASYR